MACETKKQDPLDKRIINVDFSGWLGSSLIASVAWVVASGLTASNDSNTSTVATNYFESATEKDYEVACTITTDDTVARKKTERFIISVIDECDA